MQNSIVKPEFTQPKEKNFFNLFFSIIAPIKKIGLTAQIISGSTEAVTVYRIMQSELSDLNKFLAVLLSIIAVLLVVLILEVGGRKFLQTLTRIIVWKEFKNSWYRTMFIIVSCVLAAIVFCSFSLSIHGVKDSFNAPPATFDDSQHTNTHNSHLETITAKYASLKAEKQQLFETETASVNNSFAQRIKEAQTKIDQYNQKNESGVRWASSHAEKWTNTKSTLEVEQAAAIETLTNEYKQEINKLNEDQDTETATETKRHDTATAAAFGSFASITGHEENRRNFWGNLLSSFVGFFVVLAYVCIIIEEVYNRGSERKINYVEIEKPPPLVPFFFETVSNRIDHFFRKRIYRFANKKQAALPSIQIGFRTQAAAVATNSANNAQIPVATLNTAAPPTPNGNNNNLSITDKEVLKMALKNANSFISSYKKKPKTITTERRLKEWKEKAFIIQSQINNL